MLRGLILLSPSLVNLRDRKFTICARKILSIYVPSSIYRFSKMFSTSTTTGTNRLCRWIGTCGPANAGKANYRGGFVAFGTRPRESVPQTKGYFRRARGSDVVWRANTPPLRFQSNALSTRVLVEICAGKRERGRKREGDARKPQAPKRIR